MAMIQLQPTVLVDFHDTSHAKDWNWLTRMLQCLLIYYFKIFQSTKYSIFPQKMQCVNHTLMYVQKMTKVFWLFSYSIVSYIL